ncbi:hypothetical protein LCGC14_0429400 [marine sediment metagenome]|uniref:Uncharacterized protein n=1 Tax=marine sediment metagenome TaxID=412755 RepID=A0A0F9SNA5_9ZZZZ
MPPAKRTSFIQFSYLEGGWVSPVNSLSSKTGANTISFQKVKRIASKLSREEDLEIEVTWIPDKQRSVTASKPAVISVLVTGSLDDGQNILDRFFDIASEEGLS